MGNSGGEFDLPIGAQWGILSGTLKIPSTNFTWGSIYPSLGNFGVGRLPPQYISHCGVYALYSENFDGEFELTSWKF
jgi:hypothetical protein